MTPQASREVHYEGVHCNIRMQQYPNVIRLQISGTDVGEFGGAPMKALNEWLAGSNPIDLFIDARDVRGASVEVSGDWALWLGANKEKLRDISMLTGSRYIQVTADFVRRFAALQGQMKIYTEPAAFDFAFKQALG